jgi:multiple sugar transport system permease protein
LEKIKRILNKESVAGVVFSLPFIIGFLMFILIPMLMSLFYSFCKFDIISPPIFVGFKNYIRMFTDDPLFYKTLEVTFYFVFVSVPLKLAFALFVAMLLLKNTKATGFYRIVYYLPSIIGGSVAVAVLWKMVFAEDGVFNSILGSFGLKSDFLWLGNEHTAIWVLILLAVWQFGSPMLIFLAALKQIPSTLYEAATIDGSNKLQQFLRVTLPLLTPTIFFNLLMQTIGGFLAFTQCLIITQGEPLNSTLFYAVYMYQQSFVYRSTGYGTALAWVMLLVISAMTALLFTTKRFWVYEDGV